MNTLQFASALLGFCGVALGAFGAHGLDETLSAEAQGWWETATFYLLVHAVAAFAVSQSSASAAPGWCFVLGGSLFAGTLYAMALGAPHLLGAFTPIGGVILLLGWGWLAISALRGSS